MASPIPFADPESVAEPVKLPTASSASISTPVISPKYAADAKTQLVPPMLVDRIRGAAKYPPRMPSPIPIFPSSVILPCLFTEKTVRVLSSSGARSSFVTMYSVPLCACAVDDAKRKERKTRIAAVRPTERAHERAYEKRAHENGESREFLSIVLPQTRRGCGAWVELRSAAEKHY